MEVVVIVLEGVLHRLTHLGRGREVDDTFNVLFLEEIIEGRSVADVQLIELCLRMDRRLEAGQQVIGDDDISAGVDECAYRMGADVTRST